MSRVWMAYFTEVCVSLGLSELMVIYLMCKIEANIIYQNVWGQFLQIIYKVLCIYYIV